MYRWWLLISRFKEDCDILHYVLCLDFEVDRCTANMIYNIVQTRLVGAFVMEEDRVSVTALISAFGRAFHAMNDTPKIFDDFLAYQMLSEEGYKDLGQNLGEALKVFDPERAASCLDQETALALMMRTQSTSIYLSRARYSEDNLEKAVEHGVQQYIILGAGLDTFAFRRPEMLDKLHVFEVDHPSTQGFKRRRLAELGWKHPAQLHFVPVDFAKENLASVLARSSYDLHSLSFFSWLGVTYYLTRDVVLDTLRSISHYGSFWKRHHF